MKRQAIPRTWRTLRKGVTCIPFNDNPGHADDESSIWPETKTGWYKTKKGKRWLQGIGGWDDSQVDNQASKQASKQPQMECSFGWTSRWLHGLSPRRRGSSLSGRQSRRTGLAEMMSVPFDEFLLTIWVFLWVPFWYECSYLMSSILIIWGFHFDECSFW